MEGTPTSIPEMIERIAAWAAARPDLSAVLVVGSQARADRPADQWSDLDLLLIAADPDRYLNQIDWVTEIGHPWITFVEGNVVGGRERRVLFEGALDVDFNFFGPEQFQQVARDPAAIRTFRRGIRVLLDREGRLAALAGPPDEPPVARLPEEGEFLNHVNDFWYHAVWTAKKLRRGELYTAKGCLDSHMKRQTREMAECHARAVHGPAYDTWHEGRFLEKWADPRVMAGLRTAYASYDAADLGRALRVTMELYRWLAIEAAERLGFPYPAGADERATEWVRNCLAEEPP